MKIYENEDFWVMRKPNGLATTFGKGKNMIQSLIDQKESSQTISLLYNIYQNDIQNELGLINRLDNGTGGCLFFAKSRYIYNYFRENNENHSKTYIANVYGQFGYEQITTRKTIGHHISDSARMTTESKLAKSLISCQTDIELIEYYPDVDISRLKITIQKGVRHQIRVHLAGLGYYIIGENIYTSKGFRQKVSETSKRSKQNINTNPYIYNRDIWTQDMADNYQLVESNDIYIPDNANELYYHLRSVDMNIKKS